MPPYKGAPCIRTRGLKVAQFLYSEGCRFTRDFDTQIYDADKADYRSVLLIYFERYPALIPDWLEMEYTDIFGRYRIAGITGLMTILGAIAIKVTKDKDASFIPIFERFVTYLIDNPQLYGGPASVITYFVNSGAMDTFLCLPEDSTIVQRVRTWTCLWRQGHLE